MFAINANKVNIKKNRMLIKGGRELNGEVLVEGSKNASLPMMVACLLPSNGETILQNVPLISDTFITLEILKVIGIENNLSGNTIRVKNLPPKSSMIPKNLASKVRNSILFLGPIVAKLGEVTLYHPGGDDLGERPIDVHIDALKLMGVDIEIEKDIITAKAKQLPLKGAEIELSNPSVGGTAHILITATIASGKTIIKNAAKEPEIEALIDMLNNMGGRITGKGTDKLIIEGVSDIELSGGAHKVIPDRLELATLVTAIAMTRGQATIKGFIPQHNTALLNILDQTGLTYKVVEDYLTIKVEKDLKPFKVECKPYPYISTDLQPLLTSLATQCEGTTHIHDSVFFERFNHIPYLKNMGANISAKGNDIYVQGKSTLTGDVVIGKDIRATSSILCAALCGDGETELSGYYHLQRGHANIIEKINQLNGDIKLID